MAIPKAGKPKASRKATTSTPTAPKPGRPTKYNPDLHPALGEAYAIAGFTVPQMAEKMGVAASTIKLWMEEHEPFSAAIKKGRALPDEKVERSLFELATGYEYDAEKPLVVAGPQGCGSEVQIAKYREKIPPNATAIIYWLKNRRPDKWRDKQELEHSGSLGVTIVDDL